MTKMMILKETPFNDKLKGDLTKSYFGRLQKINLGSDVYFGKIITISGKSFLELYEDDGNNISFAGYSIIINGNFGFPIIGGKEFIISSIKTNLKFEIVFSENIILKNLSYFRRPKK